MEKKHIRTLGLKMLMKHRYIFQSIKDYGRIGKLLNIFLSLYTESTCHPCPSFGVSFPVSMWDIHNLHQFQYWQHDRVYFCTLRLDSSITASQWPITAFCAGWYNFPDKASTPLHIGNFAALTKQTFYINVVQKSQSICCKWWYFYFSLLQR